MSPNGPPTLRFCAYSAVNTTDCWKSSISSRSLEYDTLCNGNSRTELVSMISVDSTVGLLVMSASSVTFPAYTARRLIQIDCDGSLLVTVTPTEPLPPLMSISETIVGINGCVAGTTLRAVGIRHNTIHRRWLPVAIPTHANRVCRPELPQRHAKVDHTNWRQVLWIAITNERKCLIRITRYSRRLRNYRCDRCAQHRAARYPRFQFSISSHGSSHSLRQSKLLKPPVMLYPVCPCANVAANATNNAGTTVEIFMSSSF